MSFPERTGVETSTYTDALSGRPIRRLTNSPMEDKHSYYDISPWSPDGSQILYNSAQHGPSQLYLLTLDE